MFNKFVLVFCVILVLVACLGTYLWASGPSAKLRAEGKNAAGLVKANAWARFLDGLGLVLGWVVRIVAITGVVIAAVWAAKKWLPGLFMDLSEVYVDFRQAKRKAALPVGEERQQGPWTIFTSGAGILMCHEANPDPSQGIWIKPDGSVQMPKAMALSALKALAGSMESAQIVGHIHEEQMARIATEGQAAKIAAKAAVRAYRSEAWMRRVSTLVDQGMSRRAALERARSEVIDVTPEPANA